MDALTLSEYDRALISALVFELRRFNDARPQPDRVVSINEAARIVGRTRQTISRKIHCGELSKVTRGGVTGILLSELIPSNKNSQ